MDSFTSTSKRKRSAWLLKILAVFLASFFALCLAGSWISDLAPKWVHKDPVPTKYGGWDSFSLFAAHGQIDADYAFYYGIGPMISRLKKADVLFVGNSRPYLTFRDSFVQTPQKQSGLSFFSLAGPGDNAAFCEAIIRRNDLHPLFIIVNEDDFFDPKLWPFQKEVMGSSPWNGWTNTYVNYYKNFGKLYMRRFIPEFVFFKANQGKENFVLNSPINNFVFVENISGEHFPLAISKQRNSVDPEYLGSARKFVDEMRSRGCHVILTFVPSGRDPDFLRDEAKQLGVDYVLPKVSHMETFDHKHLTPESSEKFSKVFFTDLFKLAEVQKVVRARKQEAVKKF